MIRKGQIARNALNAFRSFLHVACVIRQRRPTLNPRKFATVWTPLCDKKLLGLASSRSRVLTCIAPLFAASYTAAVYESQISPIPEHLCAKAFVAICFLNLLLVDMFAAYLVWTPTLRSIAHTVLACYSFCCRFSPPCAIMPRRLRAILLAKSLP